MKFVETSQLPTITKTAKTPPAPEREEWDLNAKTNKPERSLSGLLVRYAEIDKTPLVGTFGVIYVFVAFLFFVSGQRDKNSNRIHVVKIKYSCKRF
ncbi:hypothetical protein DGG96_07330 [Legionella qingyii]|uniref:Uncharacterized protein n=1 Tax=Legionella qingyii TaxID=2184757 RepID=A0A317U508_9GAMM|nr:hypothetical protein DGG96_07330 [Legionella qingyii]